MRHTRFILTAYSPHSRGRSAWEDYESQTYSEDVRCVLSTANALYACIYHVGAMSQVCTGSTANAPR